MTQPSRDLSGKIVRFRLGDSDQASTFNIEYHDRELTGRVIHHDAGGSVVISVRGYVKAHHLDPSKVEEV